MRPILLALVSVNHSAPSGPLAMPVGSLFGVGIENSVSTPAVVIRPIVLLTCSVNHSAPSGPAVMQQGTREDVGIWNSPKAYAPACSTPPTATPNSTIAASRNYR